MTTPDRLRPLIWAALAVTLASLGGVRTAAADMLAELCREGWNRGGYKLCEKAVERHPGDIPLRRLFARSLTNAGDYHRSIRVFREVTAMSPGDPHSHYELAWMLAFVRRYKEAVAPIETAIRLKPDFVKAYKAAAIIFYFAKTHADVFRVSLKAAELGDRIAMYETAEFYAEGDGVAMDHAKAVYWMERAARAGHVTAMDRLVDIYLNGKLGQRPDDGKAEYWAAAAHKARTE